MSTDDPVMNHAREDVLGIAGNEPFFFPRGPEQSNYLAVYVRVLQLLQRAPVDRQKER
jgi:hypothetical protein